MVQYGNESKAQGLQQVWQPFCDQNSSQNPSARDKPVSTPNVKGLASLFSERPSVPENKVAGERRSLEQRDRI